MLGTLRLLCNWEFDKIRKIANKHVDVRCMLGFADDDRKPYGLQTINDNLSLFTPEINDQISQIVASYGRTVAGNQQGDIRAACDSTVVKTDVHFSTDINILLDAIRCTFGSLHFTRHCSSLVFGLLHNHQNKEMQHDKSSRSLLQYVWSHRNHGESGG